MNELQLKLDAASLKLKQVVQTFESDSFLSDMAVLLTYLGYGAIPYRPFDQLDSPLRQFFYLIALNVSRNSESGVDFDPYKHEEQNETIDEIIKLILEIDRCYEEIFLSGFTDDAQKKEKARVCYPAFINYYYSGNLNYEEQMIERIEKHFLLFNSEIVSEFGLSVTDFIALYNLIDEQLHIQLNRIFRLLELEDCKIFWNKMHEEEIRPKEWKDTDNCNINELILLTKDQSEKLKIDLLSFDEPQKSQVDKFLKLISCNDKIDPDFKYLTQSNSPYDFPVYRLSDGRFLILEIKHLIYAVYNLLKNFCIKDQNLAERFYKNRGIALEKKVVEVFQGYFDDKAFVYNNYKTSLGKGQDTLIYFKGLVLITEQKSAKKDTLIPNRDGSFNQIRSSFEDIFQKGYEQCSRVHKLFETEQSVTLFDKKQTSLHTFQTKKIHHTFSLIVTLEKFAELQTDLSFMLNLKDGDPLPYSICIDDLEVLLMIMKREKVTFPQFINFLESRIQFYGRLICKDELELCGEFFHYKKLEVPPGNQPIVTHYRGTDIFENYYERGMGFKNEKNLDRKKSGKFVPHGKWLAQKVGLA